MQHNKIHFQQHPFDQHGEECHKAVFYWSADAHKQHLSVKATLQETSTTWSREGPQARLKVAAKPSNLLSKLKDKQASDTKFTT